MALPPEAPMLRNLFASLASPFRRTPARRPAPPRACRPQLERLEDRVTPATLPAGFTETAVATGLAQPTAMELAPDGRAFVAQQGGDLRVVRNGTLLATPF